MPSTAVWAVLLLAPLCEAVYKGYKPSSASEVPYATGYVMNLDVSQTNDCLAGTDDTIASFCSGGLISEGVFITAAHCFENKAGVTAQELQADPGEYTAASDGSLDVANLRVGLGTRYPYRNDDGSCSGQLRGTSDGIYKVKAVFIHKAFKQIDQSFSYSNAKTGKTSSGDNLLDHMDVAAVFLDECTSMVSSSNKARYGKIAGGAFSELALMWESFDSKNNAGGLPASFWGFGESEDDTQSLDGNGKLVPKQIRRANWNFIRGTSPPTVATGKTWANCDWLPDSTAVWSSSQDQVSDAYASTNIKANPFLACTPRNPNDESVKSQCEDKTSSATCTASKSDSGKSYCTWDGSACDKDENTAGGIGLVTYPSTGGGDSGSAVWYIENSNKLTLQDRDQLTLVHIGVASAATTFFPEWDQIIRTDYLQNWLATVIDRDYCATKPTKDYFSGFDDSVVGGSASNPPVTQSGWDPDLHFVGTVKGVSGRKGLSQLAKRTNAGDWTTQQSTITGQTQQSSTTGQASAAKTQFVSLGLVLGLLFWLVL